MAALAALFISGGCLVLREVEKDTADDAVRNQLRNLSAVANDYFAKTGAAHVHVTQLDKTALYNAGIRGRIEELQPAVIHKGRILEAPSLDRKRVVTYSDRTLSAVQNPE